MTALFRLAVVFGLAAALTDTVAGCGRPTCRLPIPKPPPVGGRCNCSPPRPVLFGTFAIDGSSGLTGHVKVSREHVEIDYREGRAGPRFVATYDVKEWSRSAVHAYSPRATLEHQFESWCEGRDHPALCCGLLDKMSRLVCDEASSICIGQQGIDPDLPWISCEEAKDRCQQSRERATSRGCDDVEP
jgi:hypothetical protein